MPLLDLSDPLPRTPNRVLVAGTSGSGKTTLASRIAERLDIPHVEIDALYHGPDWTPRPSFVDDVQSFSAQRRWVTEWQYSQVRPILADRADLVVWLDLPRSTVIRQVAVRTIVRRTRRKTLWNGNVEPPLRTILRNDEHIVRWAWRTHGRTAARMHALLATHPELPVVRLRSHRDASRWLAVALASATT